MRKRSVSSVDKKNPRYHILVLENTRHIYAKIFKTFGTHVMALYV